jgi:hypothetical protein
MMPFFVLCKTVNNLKIHVSWYVMLWHWTSNSQYLKDCSAFTLVSTTMYSSNKSILVPTSTFILLYPTYFIHILLTLSTCTSEYFLDSGPEPEFCYMKTVLFTSENFAAPQKLLVIWSKTISTVSLNTFKSVCLLHGIVFILLCVLRIYTARTKAYYSQMACTTSWSTQYLWTCPTSHLGSLQALTSS